MMKNICNQCKKTYPKGQGFCKNICPICYSKEWRKLHDSSRQRLEIQESLACRPKPKICEICGRKGTIHFDHDHKSGKFRGWICYRCNSIIGLAKDDYKILYKILKYIKTF